MPCIRACLCEPQRAFAYAYADACAYTLYIYECIGICASVFDRHASFECIYTCASLRLEKNHAERPTKTQSEGNLRAKRKRERDGKEMRVYECIRVDRRWSRDKAQRTGSLDSSLSDSVSNM